MRTLLFIGPLPEPVTGQSLACRVLLDGLPGEYRLELVDLTKREFTQGVAPYLASRRSRGSCGASGGRARAPTSST